MKSTALILAILIFAMIIPSHLSAQSKKKDEVSLFGVRILGGMHNAQADGDFHKGYQKQGIYGGVAGLVRFSQHSEIEMGIVYVQKGSSWESDDTGFRTIDDGTLKLNMIEVPVVFKYFTKGNRSSIYWEGGLAFAQILNRELDEKRITTKSQGIYNDLEDGFKKSELSLVLGIGFRLEMPLSFGLRFTTGLTHIMDKNLPPITNSILTDKRAIGILRNYGVTLLTGYAF